MHIWMCVVMLYYKSVLTNRHLCHRWTDNAANGCDSTKNMKHFWCVWAIQTNNISFSQTKTEKGIGNSNGIFLKAFITEFLASFTIYLHKKIRKKEKLYIYNCKRNIQNAVSFILQSIVIHNHGIQDAWSIWSSKFKLIKWVSFPSDLWKIKC